MISTVSIAYADGVVQKLITSTDQARLDHYKETRKSALTEAKGGNPRDIMELNEVLARPVVAFTGEGLTGKWRCRTIKAGGNFSELVIYGWFQCKVTDDGSGLKLQKITGSQRTTGRLYDDGDKRAIYLGTHYVNDEPAPAYGKGSKTDQVGYAFRTGRSAWRIEFPAPYYESKLDILEFKR